MVGKQLPRILAEAGLVVERHGDLFRPDGSDEQWLEHCGTNGRIAVSHNSRIRYVPNELEAVKRFKVALLILVGQATTAELAHNLVRTRPRIEAFLDDRSPPFIAKVLFEALEAVVGRPFARQLTPRERRFLVGLTATLMNEGGGVHDVLQHFARSLKAFVQSREFREQRRLHALLKEATQAALQAKDHVRPNQVLNFALTLTSSRVRSASQWQLYDPAECVADATMAAEEPTELSLDVVADLVRQSEIDSRTLRAHIREALQHVSQVSVGQLLVDYPAEQGLGRLQVGLAPAGQHQESS